MILSCLGMVLSGCVSFTKIAHDCGIPKGLEPLWQDSKGQRPLAGFGAAPRRGVTGLKPRSGGRRVFARGYAGLRPAYALRCAAISPKRAQYAAQIAPKGASAPCFKKI